MTNPLDIQDIIQNLIFDVFTLRATFLFLSSSLLRTRLWVRQAALRKNITEKTTFYLITGKLSQISKKKLDPKYKKFKLIFLTYRSLKIALDDNRSVQEITYSLVINVHLTDTKL